MVMPDESRYVYLYLPSAEDKARWEKLAEEASVPLLHLKLDRDFSWNLFVHLRVWPPAGRSDLMGCHLSACL